MGENGDKPWPAQMIENEAEIAQLRQKYDSTLMSAQPLHIFTQRFQIGNDHRRDECTSRVARASVRK
jgi:hypothetical protein